MKVAPVSADLLIKLALLGVGVWAVVYAVDQIKRGAGAAFGDLGDTLSTWASDAASAAGQAVSEAAAAVADVPRRVVLGDGLTFAEGGNAWKSRIEPIVRPPSQSDYYGGAYSSPLVNDSGMDFGSLSG